MEAGWQEEGRLWSPWPTHLQGPMLPRPSCSHTRSALPPPRRAQSNLPPVVLTQKGPWCGLIWVLLEDIYKNCAKFGSMQNVCVCGGGVDVVFLPSFKHFSHAVSVNNFRERGIGALQIKDSLALLCLCGSSSDTVSLHGLEAAL